MGSRARQEYSITNKVREASNGRCQFVDISIQGAGDLSLKDGTPQGDKGGSAREEGGETRHLASLWLSDTEEEGESCGSEGRELHLHAK